jgi:hypothetical protein
MYVKYVFRTLDTQGNGKITFTVRSIDVRSMTNAAPFIFFLILEFRAAAITRVPVNHQQRVHNVHY